MANGECLKGRLASARHRLGERLKRVKALLSQSDLDDTLRRELEAEAAGIRTYVQTRVHRLNGKPSGLKEA